jgi:nucleoid-associated protein YgaU
VSARPRAAYLALVAASVVLAAGSPAAAFAARGAAARPARGAGAAAAALTRLSADPYANAAAEHATEVEPDTYAHGSTIVSVFQTGRFSGGGSDDIGWATSADGGTSWQHGFLPGITVHQNGGVWQRVSDPAVAYDPKHAVWLASGLTITGPASQFGISVSRSADGVTWQNPVMVASSGRGGYDKDWITCDTTSTSPHYGNCYAEWDITSSNDQVVMSTSTDGGATWSAPSSPADVPHGLAGQPLVQPGGTVVVPFLTNGGAIRSFTSTNGGASWNASVPVAIPRVHTDGGGIRSSDLPSAQENGAGTVYVAWQDCRFRAGCSSNDIVYSDSANGTAWSAVQRVPIDPVTSTVDHFIPGFGVDPATAGAATRIGLYYYFYPQSACSFSTCKLKAGFISSANGGTSWSAPSTVAGPMSLSRVAQAGGAFVGDYIGSAFVSGHAFSSFAVGVTPSGGTRYDEGMYTVGGLAARGGPAVAGTRPVYLKTTPVHRIITRF